jgi:hypothetical protein
MIKIKFKRREPKRTISIRIGRKPKKTPRDWLEPQELQDDMVYGVCCYGGAEFGTKVKPVMGKRLKSAGDSVFEFGAVRFFKETTLPKFTYNERHLRRSFQKVIAPSSDFYAVELYQGHYEPKRVLVMRIKH